MTDTYTKGTLTVIAAALTVIAFKLVTPTIPDHAAPTLGEFHALQTIQDLTERVRKSQEIRARIPVSIVSVQGGHIDSYTMPDADSGLPGLPGVR